MARQNFTVSDVPKAFENAVEVVFVVLIRKALHNDALPLAGNNVVERAGLVELALEGDDLVLGVLHNFLSTLLRAEPDKTVAPGLVCSRNEGDLGALD